MLRIFKQESSIPVMSASPELCWNSVTESQVDDMVAQASAVTTANMGLQDHLSRRVNICGCDRLPEAVLKALA